MTWAVSRSTWILPGGCQDPLRWGSPGGACPHTPHTRHTHATHTRHTHATHTRHMRMRSYAFVCVRIRAYACVCVRMRAYACACVRKRAYACVCVRMRAYARHTHASHTPHTRHTHATHTPHTRHTQRLTHATHTPHTRHTHATHTPPAAQAAFNAAQARRNVGAQKQKILTRFPFRCHDRFLGGGVFLGRSGVFEVLPEHLDRGSLGPPLGLPWLSFGPPLALLGLPWALLGPP